MTMASVTWQITSLGCHGTGEGVDHSWDIQDYRVESFGISEERDHQRHVSVTPGGGVPMTNWGLTAERRAVLSCPRGGLVTLSLPKASDGKRRLHPGEKGKWNARSLVLWFWAHHGRHSQERLTGFAAQAGHVADRSRHAVCSVCSVCSQSQ